jgi:hypothetical protein
VQRPPLARRAVGVLGELFPEPAEPVPRRVPRGLSVLLLAAVVPVGVLVMLVRVAGTPVPAWDSIYGEDLNVFLVQALQHPWPLLVGYAGYLQLVPRLIAQVVVYLLLRDAAAAFAVTGALVTAGCALFIFHASAGHVRSVVLRLVLALAVVLLPVAQLEIADSAVNSPWYLLFALFWAVLWRPGTRAGMAGAAAVGFLTAASTTMSVVFAPLLLARVIALPRLREYAVTAGWAAGCLLQVPYVVANLGSAQSRAAHPASPGPVLAFYGHGVVLPALGWHLAWRLQALAGRNGATLIVGHPRGRLRVGPAHPARASPGVRGGRPDHRLPGHRGRRGPETGGDDNPGRGELRVRFPVHRACHLPHPGRRGRRGRLVHRPPAAPATGRRRGHGAGRGPGGRLGH